MSLLELPDNAHGDFLMDCVFESLTSGVACVRCGFKLPRDMASHPRRNCPGRCRHQGAELRPVKVVCRSGRESQADSARCDLHGACLPAYNPKGDQCVAWRKRDESKLFTLCSECGDFEATI